MRIMRMSFKRPRGETPAAKGCSDSLLERIKGPTRPKLLPVLERMSSPTRKLSAEDAAAELGEHRKAAIPTLTRQIIKGGRHPRAAEQLLVWLGNEASDAEGPLLNFIISKGPHADGDLLERVERAASVLPAVSVRPVETIVSLIEHLEVSSSSAADRYGNALLLALTAFAPVIEEEAQAILEGLAKAFPKDPLQPFYRLNDVGVPVLREALRGKEYVGKALTACRLLSGESVLELLPEFALHAKSGTFHPDCECIFQQLPRRLPEKWTEEQLTPVMQDLLAAVAMGRHPMLEQYIYQLGALSLPSLDRIAADDFPASFQVKTAAAQFADEIRRRQR